MKRLGAATHEQLKGTSQSQFLEPPDSYGVVTESISRCGAISPANQSFIEIYQFKTVLFVSEDNPHRKIVEYMKKNNIKYTQINIYSRRANLPWRTQLDELVKLSLEQLLDSNNYPMLISSSSNVHLCTIIGCLRKMQGWNLCSIMEEFRRFTPEQPISTYKNYVEMFDFDIVNIPENSPLRET